LPFFERNSRWGNNIAETCESSFLSHFGRRSLSSYSDAIAISGVEAGGGAGCESTPPKVLICGKFGQNFKKVSKIINITNAIVFLFH